MPATKVICPHCSKRLKTSKPLTVGHRVLCSRCGRSFPVQPDAIPNSPPGNGAIAPLSSPSLPSAASVNLMRIPQPLLRSQPAKFETGPDVELASKPIPRHPTLRIAVIFGGLLLLMGTTVGLTFYFATRKEPENTRAKTSLSTHTTPEERLVDLQSSDDDQHLIPTDRRQNLPSPPLRSRKDPPLLRDPPSLRPPSLQPQQSAWLPPKEQEQIDKAIDRGVYFLKEVQAQDGGWGPRVGLAALPGLTLLECGVPADDIRIQKTVLYIRRAIPHLRQTYDLALAILFLDRLGDPKYKNLIQSCALRLVAGQRPSGGWAYECRVLKPEEEHGLLIALQQTRPKTTLDLFVGGFNGNKTLGARPPGGVKPIAESPPDSQTYKKAMKRLPENLRRLPALQPPEKSHKGLLTDGTDNSNTQFAILGLWAAARHELPLERSLALVSQRFRMSEAHNGGWGYRFTVPTADGQITPSMTGAGLLGLAVGHGLTADQHSRPKEGERVEDSAVENGFNLLSQCIGEPLGTKKPCARGRTQINLYFLWTLERVGVLYNRPQIGGKDWYPWGAELLLEHQNDDGSWMTGGYPGTHPITDTCFALLFLKRANLAKDLTKKLEFFMESKKLQSGP